MSEPVEVPGAVARIYDRWHERHQRTGNIPARAECGRSAGGEEIWCSLAGLSPDELLRVQEYQMGESRAKLGRYRERPASLCLHCHRRKPSPRCRAASRISVRFATSPWP